MSFFQIWNTLSLQTPAHMHFEGPLTGIAHDAGRILRTLPLWFGIEESLQEYVRDTGRFPTFVAIDNQKVAGFVTLGEHFPAAWEVHCLAVEAQSRHRGVGKALHAHIERWLVPRGARFLQAKTLSPVNPSKAYAEAGELVNAVGSRDPVPGT